jgi:hypothetical protein
MEVVKMALMDVGKTTAGVFVANALNLEKMLPEGSNVVTKSMSKGLVYAGVSDGVELASGGRSKLLAFDVVGFANDALFLGGLSTSVGLVKADETLYNFFQQQFNVNRDTADVLTEAVIISSGRFTASVLGQYVSDGTASQLTQMVRYPASFAMARLGAQ